MNDKSIVGDVNNMVVNKGDGDDRWQKYRPQEHSRDEIHDGSWYAETYERLGVDHEKNQFLLPLIFYVDKTGITKNQRQAMEPLVFTTSLFNRSIRNQSTSWRPLGYIPNLDLSSKASKANGYTGYKSKVSIRPSR